MDALGTRGLCLLSYFFQLSLLLIYQHQFCTAFGVFKRYMLQQTGRKFATCSCGSPSETEQADSACCNTPAAGSSSIRTSQQLRASQQLQAQPQENFTQLVTCPMPDVAPVSRTTFPSIGSGKKWRTAILQLRRRRVAGKAHRKNTKALGGTTRFSVLVTRSSIISSLPAALHTRVSQSITGSHSAGEQKFGFTAISNCQHDRQHNWHNRQLLRRS